MYKMKDCLGLKNILTYSLKEEDKVLVLLPLGEEQLSFWRRRSRRASLTRLSALSFTDTVCMHGRKSGKLPFQSSFKLVKESVKQDYQDALTSHSCC